MRGDQLIITQRLLCVLVSSLPGQSPFRKQLPQVSYDLRDVITGVLGEC